MKLLMHTCCAPCSVYCIDKLREEKIEPTIYWYNPNIHPYKEYEARRNCLIDYTKSIDVNCIIEDEYGLDEFCKNVSNDLDNRCANYCYPVRLRKTFEYAKQNGFDTVTTTLLYSIYQNHDFIKAYCEKLSKEYGIDFLYRDFRVGFWEGHNKAKELGLYMQKYCGCVFSEEDRYVKKKKRRTVMESKKYNLSLAEEIINLKIANAIKNNDGKTFKMVEEEVTSLQKEKEQIYKNNEKIIEKVLTEYLKDVRI